MEDKNKLQEEIMKADNKSVEKMWKSIDEDCTFKSFLEKMTKDELVKIAKKYSVKGITTLKKADAVERMMEVISTNISIALELMEEGTLKVDLLGRGMAWLDTGTHQSMLKASNFVEAVQTTQGTFIACLEEIAYRQGWISKEQVRELAGPLMKTEYGKYLIDIIEE